MNGRFGPEAAIETKADCGLSLQARSWSARSAKADLSADRVWATLIDASGGKRTFAASCANVVYADQSAISLHAHE